MNGRTERIKNHPIALFTDFGAEGPYLGQMIAVLQQEAPTARVINLLSNAPTCAPVPSAYLLAALSRCLPPETVFLCVVDPGVGGERLAVVLEADGRRFVGPDNGLLNTTAVQSERCRWWTIEWRPPRLSASFHGRDLFAPIAAAVAMDSAGERLRPWDGPDLNDWPADRSEIVYIDHYGNAMTGLRRSRVPDGATLLVDDRPIPPGTTFCSVAEGEPFWYENSCGLVEIAVNGGRAEHLLGLSIGRAIHW